MKVHKYKTVYMDMVINTILRAWIVVLLVVGVTALVIAQSGWTANAATGFAEDFPSTGEWGLSNAFPPNTVVQVTNLHTNTSTIVTILGRKEDHSVFIILSPNAAQKIGITPRFPARVRVNPLADRSQQLDTFVETALHPDSIVNTDPAAAFEPTFAEPASNRAEPATNRTEPASDYIEYIEPQPTDRSIASAVPAVPLSSTSASAMPTSPIDSKTYLSPPATHRRTPVPMVPYNLSSNKDKRDDNDLHNLIQDTIPEVVTAHESDELEIAEPPEIVEPVVAPSPSPPAYIPSAPDVDTADLELEIPEVAQSELEAQEPAPPEPEIEFEPEPETDIHELAAVESDSTPPQDLVYPNKLYDTTGIVLGVTDAPSIEDVVSDIEEVEPAPAPTTVSIYLESAEPRPAVAIDLPVHDQSSIDHNQYYIQIGAFRDLIVAEDVLTKLQHQQKNVFVYTNERVRDGLNRVLVGPLANDERGALLSWIRNQGYADAYSKQGSEL